MQLRRGCPEVRYGRAAACYKAPQFNEAPAARLIVWLRVTTFESGTNRTISSEHLLECQLG